MRLFALRGVEWEKETPFGVDTVATVVEWFRKVERALLCANATIAEAN